MKRLVAIAVALCLGCSPSRPATAPGKEEPFCRGMVSGVPVEPFLPTCPKPDEPTCKARGFTHTTTSVAVHRATPYHVVQDVLTTRGHAVEILARFAYGPTFKDLESEWVDGLIELCGGWTPFGRFRTNNDGFVRATLPPALRDLPVGDYPMRFVVEGDASDAPFTLRIRPRGTHLIAFDVDGTLTTGDSELGYWLFSKLFQRGRTYAPRSTRGAAQLTWAHHDRHAELLYLTARPSGFLWHTRDWLDDHGFAPGTVHFTDDVMDAVLKGKRTATYKRQYLKSLLAAGFEVDLAYGNADTDIDAYLAVGLKPRDVYIIGPFGGQRGTNAVSGTWLDEARRVEGLPWIVQPGQKERAAHH